MGNAAHMLLVASLAAQSEADIVLRIDDADSTRFRQEYLQDIFDVLHWLELPWDIGPRSIIDMREWTQSSRLDHYQQARDFLVESGQAYACECSRSDWRGYEGNSCPRACHERGVVGVQGETALRVHLEAVEDPVIWRRDDLPAYHLTSVVDDDLFSVDIVVRGEDLKESTQIQRELSALLPDSTFRSAHVVHHPLIANSTGKKLSKSAGSQAQPMERTPQMRADIEALAAQLAAGTTPVRPRSPGS
jgi:glutamyl-tRNA synthetase